MVTLARNRWIWFFVLLTLVITSNFTVYRMDSLAPVPAGVAIGSLFDFLVTIPLMVYFFIIRKRYPLRYLLPVMLAGYGAACLIIPNGLLTDYSFVKYILAAGEAAFFLGEVFVIYKIAMKIPKIIKSYRLNEAEIPAFSYQMQQAWAQHFPESRLQEILLSDFTIYYYSLFSWRKKPLSVEHMYSYHKKTSAIALKIMLIHALVIESVGFHFLLHTLNPAVAIIILLLNVYTVLIFIAEIQAIRHCPFMITDQHLYLQVGLMKKLIVPLEKIKDVHYYQGPEKLIKEEAKVVFDAVVTDFFKEKPTVEVEFTQPVEAKLMYGFKRNVNKAHLRPDELQKFYEALTAKITEAKAQGLKID